MHVHLYAIYYDTDYRREVVILVHYIFPVLKFIWNPVISDVRKSCNSNMLENQVTPMLEIHASKTVIIYMFIE